MLPGSAGITHVVILHMLPATTLFVSWQPRYCTEVQPTRNVSTGLKGTHHIKGQDPTEPRLTAFMRQNLQAVFNLGEDQATPHGSDTAQGPQSRHLSSVEGSMVDVCIRPNEFDETVSVDIAEAGQPLQVETVAVKLDITPLMSVDIRSSDGDGFGQAPARVQVTERRSSAASDAPAHI